MRTSFDIAEYAEKLLYAKKTHSPDIYTHIIH